MCIRGLETPHYKHQQPRAQVDVRYIQGRIQGCKLKRPVFVGSANLKPADSRGESVEAVVLCSLPGSGKAQRKRRLTGPQALDSLRLEA